MTRRTVAAVLALVACLGVATARAGRLELSGVVYTERAAERVTVRAWAGPVGVARDPSLALRPLAETQVAPGRPWRLAVDGAEPPLWVEAAAPGHVAARRPLLPGEDPDLPPVWLPAGTRATVRVERPDGAARAVVWGAVGPWPPGTTPSGWTPAIPRTVLGKGKGEATAWLPAEARNVGLTGWSEDGAWGEASERGTRPGQPLRLRLRKGWIRVRVRDRRGEPVAGARVAVLHAPSVTAAVTGEDGGARLAAGGESWTVVARAGSAWGRASGHGAPREPVTVRVETGPAVTLTRGRDAGPVAVLPEWIPEALLPEGWRGSGAVSVPAWEPGRVRVMGPGIAARWMMVDPGAAAEIPVQPAPEAVIAGRVVGPDGEPLGGVPVRMELPHPGALLLGYRRGSPYLPLLLPQAVSGGDGSFRIGRLWRTGARLEARREGFPPARSKELRLQPGATAEVTLRFAAGTWVRLRAVDPGGAPLPGASARLCRPQGGRLALFFAGSGPACSDTEAEALAAADEEGVARLEPVGQGTYDLEVRLAGFVRRTLRDLEVPAEGLDLGDVTLEPGAPLRGVTVGPDGKAVAHAEVMLARSPEVFLFEPTLRSGDDGRFEIPDLPRSGEVYLQARADGLVPQPPLKVELPAEDEVRVGMDRERELAGVVVEKESGRPIEGAAVSVSVKRQISMGGGNTGTAYLSVAEERTGADGTFRVGGLGQGSYQLIVGARGRRPQQRTVELAAEGEPPRLVFELERGLEIAGRVVDDAGVPVAGASVEASRHGGTVGAVRTLRVARSGADGGFRLDGLEPGRYELRAQDEGGRTGRATAEAGAEGEVVIRLRPNGALVVRVVDGDGAPVAGAEVRGYGPGARYGPGPELGTTGPDGTVRVEPAAAGTWNLSAEAPGFTREWGQAEVKPGETAELELRLERGGTVVGEVRGLTAEELGRCRVWAGSAEASPGPDGRFRLEGVKTGRVAVYAALMPGGRSRTAAVEVPEDGTPAEVVFDFAAGVTLSGTVRRGGVGVPGLTVEAALAGHGSGGLTVTGSDGEYEIGDLDEGEYFVTVRDGMGRLLASEDVTVTGDATLDLDLPAASLSGTVVDAETSAPVPGALVTARRAGVPAMRREAVVGEDGRFAFEEVPDGEWRLEARDAEGREAHATVTVADGTPAEATLALEPRAPLVLVVSAAEGPPPDWVTVSWAAGGAAGGPVSAECGGGRCEVRGLPEGDLLILVAAREGGALAEVRVPSEEPVPVTLQKRGTLLLRGEPGEGGALWRARVLAPGGRPVPAASWRRVEGTPWVLVTAEGTSVALPPGSYRVEGLAPDGTVESRDVSVSPGGETTVQLGG